MDHVIKELREEAGISRYALAKEAGLTESALYQLESGRRQGTNIQTMVQIAQALSPHLKQDASDVLARLTGIDTPTPLEEATS